MLLTSAEAAEILDMHPGSVDRLVHQGRLPKAEKWAKRGLDLDDVEQASLERLHPRRWHPYWADVSEAAEVLGVSPNRVRQLIDRGFLPAERGPRQKWYFRRHQLDVIANAWDARAWADLPEQDWRETR